MKRCILRAIAVPLSIMLCAGQGEADSTDKKIHDGSSSPTIIGCDLYQLSVPKGWKCQVSVNEMSLVAENIPAWIVIQPHKHVTLEEVRADINQEPSLEDMQLSHQMSPALLGESMIVTNFAGTVCGIPAQVRLIGTISPYQGGVFIFACTSSDECFAEVCTTADAIVNEIQYLR